MTSSVFFCMEKLSALVEPLQALGFDHTGDPERPFVRKGKPGTPTVVVKLEQKLDAHGKDCSYLSVDGEPFRVYGGSVEARDAFTPQAVCDAVRVRMRNWGIKV